MKFKKTFAMMLALMILAGCTSTGNPDESVSDNTENAASGESVEKSQFLTHVFRGEMLSLPEDYYLSTDIAPLYDAESGNITCYCSYEYLPEGAEESRAGYVQEKHLLTLSSDGTVIEDRRLEIEGEEDSYITYGVLTEDSFLFMSNIYDYETFTQTYYLMSYDFTDGTLKKSDSLQPLFTETDGGSSWFYISSMAVDNEGFIYLAADQEILVLDENFVRSFSVFSSSWFDGLTASPDGVVYTYGYFENGRGLCPIDKAAKSLGTPVNYEGSSGLRDIFFGEGYDMYFTDDDGLYGLTLSDGSYEMVMSFQNSDVTGNALNIMKIIGPETFIASERDSAANRYAISIYKKADDIDLSTVKVIELACAGSTDYDLSSMIVSFNKANPGVRIIVNDYSRYNTSDNYTAGMTKLTTDILNGLYKPDIITGSTNSDLFRQVIGHDLYTDLYTFIDKDDRITRDDLFGGFTRTYSDDGRLWGICKSFEVNTLIGPKSILGERESWTFAEMLDFADSLPDDVELMQDINQTSVQYAFFGMNGYGAFIDDETNTAHFDSEDFIHYLTYIASLPQETDYSAITPDTYKTRYLARHNGQVALENITMMDPADWISQEVLFNTKEYTLIGFPTANEGEPGSYSSSYSSYIITSFAEYPEEAWSFLRDIAAPETIPTRYYSHDGFPILKSVYDEVVEGYYTNEYVFDLDGTGGRSGPYDPENPTKPEDLTEPGIITYFTPEDAASLKEFLDTKVGAPSLTEAVDEEIIAIINEEISSFTSGMRDAQSCADIIQSRVSIWLAEHE